MPLALGAQTEMEGAACQWMLESDTIESRNGYFQLQWQANTAECEGQTLALYQLQPGPQRLIYKGSNTTLFISGQPAGQYVYQLYSEPGTAKQAVGQQLTVQVEHYPLWTAFSYFGIGLFVFIGTLLLIGRGDRTA
ncbi:MAG: hypothetical protein KDK39_04090 [Leptospiraceae bacterium]|nr:hypothetical protein [Leptospiraceae bacterium]